MKVLLQLFGAWFRMGLFTFGGGYAMLPMIQKEVIEKYHWATEDEIMDYYAIGQVTPGIIAVNTATFVGYQVAGVIGAVFSTLGVVSPSLIIIMVIAGLIKNFSDIAVVQSALRGIQVAVCVLMFTAIIGPFKKGVKDKITFVICAVAFICSYFLNISTVILVILAGVTGFVMMKLKKNGGKAA